MSSNGIEAKPGEFFSGSSLEYLAWCVRGHRFGGIVLDPPSFARYKGTTFRVHEDLRMLVGVAASILDPDGSGMVSTNYSGYTCGTWRMKPSNPGKFFPPGPSGGRTGRTPIFLVRER